MATRASPIRQLASRRVGPLAIFALACSAFAGCYPQTAECEQYVECQVHYEEALSLPETTTNRFQPDGVCWESEFLSDGCTAECIAKVQTHVIDLQEANEDLGPCG